MSLSRTSTWDTELKSEILLELALAIDGSRDLETMLGRTLPVYARKLGCAMAGVLDAERKYTVLPVTVPQTLNRNPLWQEAVCELVGYFGRHPEDTRYVLQVGDYYFHAHVLLDYGLLILGRSQMLPGIFLRELEPVMALLARSCCACRDHRQKVTTQRLHESMYRLTEAGESIPSFQDFCQKAQAIVARFLPSSNMFIALRNPESGWIEFPYFYDQKDPPPAPRPPQRGLVDYVLATGKTFHYQDEAARAAMMAAGYEPLGTPASDWVGMPLKQQEGQVFGVLAMLLYDPGNCFHEQDLYLLTHVAEKVATIYERIQTRSSLRQSEERYRLLFNSMTSGFALHDVVFDESGAAVDYRYLEVNPAFEKLTGIRAEIILNRTVREIMPGTEPIWIQRFCEVALSGKPLKMEHYAKEIGKTFAVTAYSPKPGQFAVVFSDISDRIAMEEQRLELERQLQHTQKLESLGLLAGGIAHDFNNLLMAILGNLELASEGLPPHTKARRDLAEAIRAANRAALLTKQMLAYSGKGVFSIEVLDLNQLIEENMDMLRAAIPVKVQFDLQLTKPLPRISADAAQIQQIVMNLITNGAESIEQQNGTVTLRSGFDEFTDDALAASQLDEKPEAGKYVWVEVSDTGCGMDDATRQRLFDPFFTTKFTGRGLGLSAVLGIVRAHKGAIFVHSEPGRGTTFKVLFPASAETTAAPESGAVPQALSDPEASHTMSTKGTVLVAEDDDAVRRLCANVIQRCGYIPLQAENGEAAVELFRRHQPQIVGVLLDLTMPNMDGIATIEELRKMAPDVRVILASGFSQEEMERRCVNLQSVSFIQKPFELTKLRSLLNHSFATVDGAE
jgi:PAS domain S-box-containing protein